MTRRNSTIINLEKLKEIKELRKVWPHEALNFTPWLAEEDNLTLLAEPWQQKPSAKHSVT
ncbi:hypothetical protein EXD82_01285 [Peptacetobacter hominis]|uniref:Uncharacterized protein n=1 Tax=Peptacetobacter hominis TaxID=2743610 RepID=A0A544QXM7_9FIRM|nr:hypothetical protein EXD82_01285 [Peptacetobacter hominis]